MKDYRIVIRDGEKTTTMLLSEANPKQIAAMVSIEPIQEAKTTTKNPQIMGQHINTHGRR